MRRAQFLVLLALLSYTANAHKAIEDEDVADMPEELQDTKDTVKREMSEADKARQDPNFFESLDAIQPVVEKDAMYYIQTYRLEGAFMCFFVFCFIILFVGKRHNNALAQIWHQRSLPMIKDNFTYVGMDDGIENLEMEATSFSEFTFYASGRKNCFYALFKLDMFKRHCVLSKWFVDRMYSQGDVLTVDIPVRFPGDYNQAAPVPIEFFLCRKSKVRSNFDMHEHFKSFVSQVKADNLPVPKPPANKKEAKEFKNSDHLVVLAESEEAANQIVDAGIGDVLKAYGHCLIECHITDQQVYNKYPCFLRTKILIGESQKEQEDALRILKAIFQMLDKVVRMKLNESNRTKAERVRKKVDAVKNKDKNDEIEEKQLEKERQERLKYEAKLRTLNPEQQRRLEEKKRKQEVQQQKKKMTKLSKY